MEGDRPGDGSALDAARRPELADAVAALAGEEAPEGLERRLLRSLVSLGIGTQATLWWRPTPRAPWRPLRSHGGEAPSPEHAAAGGPAVGFPLGDERHVVVTLAAPGREAREEAAELLVTAAALLWTAPPAIPPPLPERE